MKTKKITLIGGAGFIGHNMAIYLKKKGFDISVIDGRLLYYHTNKFKNKIFISQY